MNGETMVQVGTEINLATIKQHLNESRSGGFMFVRGYENKEGEVSDYWLQFGISYPALKARDIIRCQSILDGNEPLTLTVKFGVYVNANGERFNRKAEGRTPMTETLVLDMTDSRLQTAVAEVMESLIHPAPAKASYSKEAKGLYENENDGVLHLRDALLVHKEVRKEGEYPFSASSADVAIRNAVRRQLLTGRYRQFIFDGRFDAISIGGVAILVDGIDEKMYFADTVAVREAVQAQAVA